MRISGYVVDRKRAKINKCKCYVISKGQYGGGIEGIMCWVKGVIGTLSKEQIKEFCPFWKREIIEESELREHINRFRKAVKICKKYKFPKRLDCMSKYLTKVEKIRGE